MMYRIQKKVFFFVLFFALSITSLAQEHVLDSLSNELKLHTQKDSTRVDLLVGLAWNMAQTKPEEAFPYIEEAIEISKIINWEKGRALALRQKGNLYYIMANNLEALDAYQEALTISSSINDRELEAGLYGNLGNIHADLKEYDEALEKYDSYLETSITLGNKSDQVKALTNIAIIYNDTDRYDEGIPYLHRALSLSKEEENDFFVAAITNNLALAYKNLKEYKKALNYYEEALGMAKKVQSKYIEASALNSIGKVSILLKNYDLAGESGEKALQIAQEMGAVEWQADSWKVLSAVYEYQGKTGEALTAYKNHIQFRDSVLSEEKRAELTKKEMQFELEKQETEANAEIKRQSLVKNTYLIGGILLLFATVVGYFLYKKRRDALEKEKMADFKAKVAETELKALRSQMNPHFIFNSFNSISDFISKNDIKKANEYLLKFAKLTRSILENSEKKWISLEDDLELMELYMQIEALRLKNKLSYSITVDEGVDRENTLLPPLMLQPFIENSIWHGIAKKKTKGHIKIIVKEKDNMLVCIVEDDGIGRNNVLGNNKENKSMGVRITKNRLDIINQLKKANGSVKILDKEQGLRVELKLPLELQF